MIYFYHGVPEDMKGTTIIPLNEMMLVDPELRNQYLQKYKGREEVLERLVPLIDCSWSDVIQLLPLHPKQLFELQKQLGIIDTIPDYQYYQIDPWQLETDKTVVYFKTAPGEENVTVRWLRDVDLGAIQDIPLATTNYYRSMVGVNQPVFNYQFVPHIIYKGSIDISGVDKISLTDS